MRGERRILVTGAAGRVGLAVTAACAARDLRVRAYVPGPDQAEQALAAGAQEVVQGRFGDEAILARACLGADAVYHVAPRFDPDEVMNGARVIAAARAAGVSRLVYHSVLHPQITALPHHWRKMRVEEMLFASGLDVTALQPAPLLQDVVERMPAIRETGLYADPCSIHARVSFVDLGDVAAVAARVLDEDGHAGATYELVGTAPLTRLDIAGALSRRLHMPVRAVEQSLADWEAETADLPADRRDALGRMYAWIAAHGLVGSPTVLRLLLGREPRGLEDCLASASG